MTVRDEAHRVVDQLSDSQLERLLAIARHVADLAKPMQGNTTNLSQFDGVIRLAEDPLAYQTRSRFEWT
jgi:hypothetical protein